MKIGPANKLVVVVSKNNDGLGVVNRVLDEFDAIAKSVACLKVAERISRAEDIALIICDEVCNVALEFSELKNCKAGIILLSRTQVADVIVKHSKSGPIASLRKPVGADELRVFVKQAFNVSEKRRHSAAIGRPLFPTLVPGSMVVSANIHSMY